MQNQVNSTLAPIIRHIGNFCRLFDSQKNQKIFLLPLDIFKADELKRLRERLTILKMEVGLSEDVESIISKINDRARPKGQRRFRSEEHTSELQSLMRISYAVFCLKKKKQKKKK